MKKIMSTAALAAMVAGAAFVHLSAQAPSSAARSRTQPAAPSAVQSASQAKIASLVAQMTLDEKLSMLYGTTDPTSYGQAGYLKGVPRLGIPPLRLTDGPAGVRVADPATALPAPVALAATFSPALARQYGQVIGRDARAHHQNVVLGPMVNIVRVPQGGRNFETLGEDPVLASRLVAAEVEGIQGEGVIACIKHYAFNNQEDGRQSVSADVDERVGREIELPGFEAAVRAGVGSAMSAYNKVNGTWASENPWLLTDVLREDWGFKGFVMSDWGATHSVAALAAGQEMEMPSGRYYGGLKDALDKGELKEAVVDEAVKRILTAMDSAGLLASAERPVPEIAASSPVARDIAIAGAVLLKNQGNVLPLGREDVGSLLVIGPTAKTLLVGGGGSARVRPMRTDSPLDVLQRQAGVDAHIAYVKGYDVDGEPVPASVLRPSAEIDLTGAKALSLPAGSSFVWTGRLVPPTTGDYVLALQTIGARGTVSFEAQNTGRRGTGGRGGATAASAGRGGRADAPAAGTAAPTAGGRGGSVPDVPVQAMPGSGTTALLATADGFSNTSYQVRLQAGTPIPVTITVQSGQRGQATPAQMQVRLAWMTPEIQNARIEEAVAAARKAKTVVLFAYDEGSEGRDRRSLSLPGYQDALIDAVAAVNPRTVVVLNNGAPILMPWADKVAAILQMWYAGQEGADATSAVLLGASPGGRLPVTFPRRAEDAPTAEPERYPGVNGRGAYSEGIFVGYRWYDRQKIEPLFPFGHGLSYTTFAYSGLSVKAAGDGYDVKFTVRNTGTREGADVPQVYLGPPAKEPVPMAPRQLVAFDRVSLAPGQSRQLILHVDARALSYWSTADHDWKIAPGRRMFMLGASSRDIKLQAPIEVRARRRTTS